MALKRTENLIIGFDTQTNVVKILRNYGDNFYDVVIEQFDIDTQLVENKSVAKLLNTALENYTAEHQTKQQDVYIVLPDHLVTIDQIKLPMMSKPKLKNFVTMELKRNYPNFLGLETNITTMSKSKKQITYSATLVDKIVLKDCATVCKKFNLNLRNVSYASNCLVNSVLALAPKAKHANFLLLNVQESESKLIYVTHDRTICFGVLPFGENFLNDGNSANLDNHIQNTNSLREVFNSTEILTQTAGSGTSTFEEAGNKAFGEFCEKRTADLAEKQTFVENIESNHTNFATFVNFAVGLQDTVVNTYGLPKPEILFVNIKPQLFEEKIKHFEFDIPVQLLKDEIAGNCLLGEYLDLFGAIYAGTFNAGQNFLDKENKAKDGIITTKTTAKKGR